MDGDMAVKLMIFAFGLGVAVWTFLEVWPYFQIILEMIPK